MFYSEISMYSLYYQATICIPQTWKLVAFIRAYDHAFFDRTLDSEKGIMEFFVPPLAEKAFCAMMDYLMAHGVIYSYTQLPNRLESEALNA